jgi:hypothetical protein
MEKLLNNIKNNIWEILIVIGALPFAYTILSGIYMSIIGFSGLCLKGCNDSHGISAFMDWIVLFIFVYWPLLLIGAILIILGIIMVERKIKKRRINI